MIDGGVNLTAVGGGGAALASLAGFLARDYFKRRNGNNGTAPQNDVATLAVKLDRVISLLELSTGNTSSIRQDIALMKGDQTRMANDIAAQSQTLTDLRVDIAGMGK